MGYAAEQTFTSFPSLSANRSYLFSYETIVLTEGVADLAALGPVVIAA